MLWRCFSAAGTERLVRVKGRMNAAIFREVFEENLLQSAGNLRPRRRFPFQPDNDPKAFSQDNAGMALGSVTPLEWPSQRPDLNLIENLWGDPMIAVHRRFGSNLTELERISQEEWH